METYDAIVIGSGAVGGWAAKDLTEGGASVLVIEAGSHRELRTVVPSPATIREVALTGVAPRAAEDAVMRQPVQSRHWAYNALTAHLYVDDLDNPYLTPPDRPFEWYRSRIVGGRTLLWGGMMPRMSDLEFKAASRDGYGDDWPIGYRELAPFYSRVEEFYGVHGGQDNLPQMPDGVFLPPMSLTTGEQQLKAAVEKRWSDRHVVPLRGVHAGIPAWIAQALRQGESWPRFTSNGSTLSAAMRTGRLTLLSDSVVSHITIDPHSGRAKSVAYVDAATKASREVQGRVIVLAASTIETTRILLNSKSPRHPAGLGNSSGTLGRYLMDHPASVIMGRANPASRAEVTQDIGGPYGVCIPKFRNVSSNDQRFIRGYGIWGTIQRGPVGFQFTIQNEMLARYENRVSLDEKKTDAWGIPCPVIDCSYGDNDVNMDKDARESLSEMLAEAGLVPSVMAPLTAPGGMIHELGTARMGSDPRASVVNSDNQCWDAPNVYVTDGACFVSGGWQNPTLTMLALTARACRHILDQGKR